MSRAESGKSNRAVRRKDGDEEWVPETGRDRSDRGKDGLKEGYLPTPGTREVISSRRDGLGPVPSLLTPIPKPHTKRPTPVSRDDHGRLHTLAPRTAES